MGEWVLIRGCWYKRGLAGNLGENLACGAAGIVAFWHKERVGAAGKAVDRDAQALGAIFLYMD